MAGRSESFAILQPHVAEILASNIDMYNPNNIRTLETYIDAQSRENTYDLEANILLLKLYQLNPAGHFNATPRGSYVAKVLLKALMHLPSNDFQICKALADPELLKIIKIQDVVKLEHLLETCQFETFWQEMVSCQDTVGGVEGFDDAVREYICSVIGMTNQSITVSSLQSFLGKVPFEKFKRLVEAQGWKIQQNSVFIKDQTANIKSRKITEAIDFAGKTLHAINK